MSEFSPGKIGIVAYDPISGLTFKEILLIENPFDFQYVFPTIFKRYPYFTTPTHGQTRYFRSVSKNIYVRPPKSPRHNVVNICIGEPDPGFVKPPFLIPQFAEKTAFIGQFINQTFARVYFHKVPLLEFQRLKIQHDGIHAKSLVGRGWAIVKNVSQMRITPGTFHFDALHIERIVRFIYNAIGTDRFEKAG